MRPPLRPPCRSSLWTWHTNPCCWICWISSKKKNGRSKDLAAPKFIKIHQTPFLVAKDLPPLVWGPISGSLALLHRLFWHALLLPPSWVGGNAAKEGSKRLPPKHQHKQHGNGKWTMYGLFSYKIWWFSIGIDYIKLPDSTSKNKKYK